MFPAFTAHHSRSSQGDFLACENQVLRRFGCRLMRLSIHPPSRDPSANVSSSLERPDLDWGVKVSPATLLTHLPSPRQDLATLPQACWSQARFSSTDWARSTCIVTNHLSALLKAHQCKCTSHATSLTETSRVTFDHVSGHPMAQPSWHGINHHTV